MHPIQVVRALWRAARRGAHRLVHPLRRHRAEGDLAGFSPRRVLFLCHGNICRSPYAAEAFRRALPSAFGDGAVTVSGGFMGPGRPSPPEAVAVAAARGIDLASHRSQVADAGMLRSADLVVVMEGWQAAAARSWLAGSQTRVLVLGDLDPAAGDGRAIADPVDQPAAAFVASYDRIDRCLAALVRILTDGRTP